MLGLPNSTECKKALPKTALFAQFEFTSAQKKDFNASFGRFTIVNEVTPHTTHIPKGETVGGFFVLHVSLRQEKYDTKPLLFLAKRLPHKVLFLLEFEDKGCIALYHTAFFQTAWQNSSDLSVTLQGVDFDAAWASIVQNVGAFTIEKEQTLEKQIAVNEEHAKLAKEIERLEKKARAEKQPRRKLALVAKLRELKVKLHKT